MGISIKIEPYSKPFASLNDPRLSEIEQIYTWLEKWSEHDSKDGKLSKEPFHSLILTLKSFRSFISHIFLNPSKLGVKNCKIEYILTGKLQTDILGKRFGIYRQLNGSLKEVSSSKKKKK